MKIATQAAQLGSPQAKKLPKFLTAAFYLRIRRLAEL